MWFQVFHMLAVILSANPLLMNLCRDSKKNLLWIFRKLLRNMKYQCQAVFKNNRGMLCGLQKLWDQECSRIKRQNTYVKSYGTSTGATHCMEKRKQSKRGKRREKGQMMSVDGQDLTIYGSCQGYMDFFSEVFCVVSFFLLYIFAHQKTPRWKM